MSKPPRVVADGVWVKRTGVLRGESILLSLASSRAVRRWSEGEGLVF